MSKDKPRILFLLSGSIACFKAAEAVSALVKSGYDVQCVTTCKALEFVGEATLEGLTGRKVFTDLFDSGHAMDHIHWARWADLSILCPASASCINGLASGLANDSVGALFMAHDLARGTFWIAPAMNSLMLSHPATQASLAELTQWGARILLGESGALACGEYGPGRLIEPAALHAEVDSFFAAKEVRAHKHVVVTSGGTREAIDPVRSITNQSTGATGKAIAEFLVARGHRVTVLAAEQSLTPEPRMGLRVRHFVSASDLSHILKETLASDATDCVIHAAAVSDFTVKTPSTRKLDSSRVTSLELTPTEKIVDHIRTWSNNPALKLIAFKLTHESPVAERTERSLELLRHSGADLVVSNDQTEISDHAHPALGIGAHGVLFHTKTKRELSLQLSQVVEA